MRLIKKKQLHFVFVVGHQSRSVKIDRQIYYPFILRKKEEYGNSTMYLVGSLPQLGGFNPKLAIPMDEEIRNDEVFYTKYIDIRREDFPFDYKYF